MKSDEAQVKEKVGEDGGMECVCAQKCPWCDSTASEAQVQRANQLANEAHRKGGSRRHTEGVSSKVCVGKQMYHFLDVCFWMQLQA